MRTLLAIQVVALILAAGCAHGASWDRSDRSRMSFDGEDPSMVRVVTDADTFYMPHPVTRGDSLVGKYGHGEAVALEEIDRLETYAGASDGLSTGGVIALSVLGLAAALIAVVAIACAGDDFC